MLDRLCEPISHSFTVASLGLIGNGFKWSAVESAGIDYSTFCKWRQRGERAGRGPYVEFVDDLKKAEAGAIIRNVTIIQKAALGGEVLKRTTVTKPDGTVVVTEKMSAPQWQAAAFWLERRYPEEWSKRMRLEHPAPQGPLISEDFIFIEDRVGRRVDGLHEPRVIEINSSEDGRE
jgi:hypothetical protein